MGHGRVKSGLGIHEQSIIPLRQLAHHCTILVHHSPHGVGPVGFDEKWGHQDETLEPRPRLAY